MRLFLFLVGGTGSRVLRPLVMQLAAGILPTDADGHNMPLEIVPMIIDPHKANEDLKRTENLLRGYKQIRKELYGERNDVDAGFFAAKISTLSDIIPAAEELPDTFLFNMGGVDSKKFASFISFNTLDSANQALCSMMFSRAQLDTKMDIGFVGSPNIGSVALNMFKDSNEFKQFSNVFQKTDRVFVVSSIFGGTGAAGYPVIVKNIRGAAMNANVSNRGDLRDAKIGALTVLPYFNIQQDENSPISRADFISKTKSALFYYHDNLTGIKRDGKDTGLSRINACYYVGDEVPSTPYFNDPGGNGQRNDAHIVEFVGALAIIDFLQIPDDKLHTANGVATNPIFKEYGLAANKLAVTLKDLGLPTRMVIDKQMAKFHLAYMYITHQLKNDVGRGFTQDKPELTKTFFTTTFFTTLTGGFFVAYLQWLRELKANQRSFEPFNLDTDKLKDCLRDIEPKTGFLKSTIDYKTVLSAMNSASQKAVKTSRFNSSQVATRLMTLLNETLDKIVDDKFNGVV